MPHLILNNDKLEVKVFNRHESQTGINVVHYHVSGTAGGSLTDAQVVGELSTLFAPLYKAMMPGNASFSGVRLQKIRPEPVTVAVASLLGAGAGTAGGNMLPTQASILISKRTALAGRANRGRMYIPFISDALATASGEVAPAGLAAATALMNAMFATITVTIGGASVTLQPIVFNRASGGSVFINALLLRTAFATQRRRGEINRGDVPGP